MSWLLPFAFPVLLVALVVGGIVGWIRSGEIVGRALRGELPANDWSTDEALWFRALERELAREMDRLDRPLRRRRFW